MKKALLAVALLVVGVAFACSLQAATVQEVLKDSIPLGQEVCAVPTEKHGVMVLACTKGLRADGADIYLVFEDPQTPLAVYEVVNGGVPKLIWHRDWKGA